MLKYVVISAVFRKPITHIILIALLGLVVYSNTFNVPFQWDEGYFISENPVVKDFSYFLEPSKAKGHELYGALKSRYIGYLTFALNYKLHGLDVKGYHAVNIAIHLVNAILIYWLVLLTFRTPFLSGSSLKEHSRYISLFTALIFVAHPIQTEAVTYIFQRLASLAAMFYLASIVLYAKWRLRMEIALPSARKDNKEGVIARSEATKQSKFVIFYFLSLLAAVLAMKTKENAFTLPVAIGLYEFLFFCGRLKWRFLYLVPFITTMLIIPFTIIGVDKPVGEVIGGMMSVTGGYAATDKMDYLFTQFRVVLTYLRLLFFPINQNIGYDYPVYKSFFDMHVFLSFISLFAFFCIALYLVHRSKGEARGLRIMGFGIIWFFLALSVESSIIPIPMVINEYRLYLPSVGVFISYATAVVALTDRFKKANLLIPLIIIVPLVLALAAYKRNGVWKSEIALWEDMVKKSPNIAMGHYNLGVHYNDASLYDKAIEHFQTAIRFNPDYVEAHCNLGLAYWSKGLTNEALEHINSAANLKPDFELAHYNLGVIYNTVGMIEEAISHYETAVRLKPDYAEVHNNLGMIYKSIGRTAEAVNHLSISVSLKPDAAIHYSLGLLYAGMGEIGNAVKHYEVAIKLNPGLAEAHNNLGMMLALGGLDNKAMAHFKIALRINPAFAGAYYNLGNIYASRGLIENAIEQYETAVRLKPDFVDARHRLEMLRGNN